MPNTQKLILGLVALIAMLAQSYSYADIQVLPVGSAPSAIVTQHFPDRVHEFVWRNWTVVAPEKLATIIGATPEQVTAIATSMGLPASPVVSPDIRKRGYVSLIRRNWHLLPYEQLLQLLEMTPEHLAVMLREEDFLWIKLGQLKPACEPIRYTPPTDAAVQRAGAIRQIVEQDFGDAFKQPSEARFDFVRQLAETTGAATVVPKSDTESALRIVYSYVAVYGDPLMNPELNPYPDGLLQRLAASGVNGVWLQAVLRDLAPGGTAFPEFGKGHEERLTNLQALVERAQRFGIRVYLYINEPRSMPKSFFDSRPDTAGVVEGEMIAMCTSSPVVRQWMGDALAHIFRETPGLGGVYCITASENLTNCASHGAWSGCTRCKDRSDTDVISEVVGVIDEGVHRGDPNAKVLISDWGWKGHGDSPDIIAKLPKSVWLMSVSEWHLPIERGGIKSTVGEYSISAIGPGPRALPHWKQAREQGMHVGTEIQFNNTCEIASIPYLPVLDLIAEHCYNLETQVKLDAMFIGWTMGGHPSPNFQVAQRMSAVPTPTIESALEALAIERFGEAGAPHARAAWKITSDAFREYPFHISVIYTSPVQWGTANPLYPTKTGYSATMWGLPYDDAKTWSGPYPPEILAAQFEKVATGWQPGIAELQKAVEAAPADKRDVVSADLRYARAASIHFQSVANQTRFVVARDALQAADSTLTAEQRQAMREQVTKVLESEFVLARELYGLVQTDSRIGFEPSCQYFYFPLDLVEKVVNCRWLLENMEQWAKPG